MTTVSKPSPKQVLTENKDNLAAAKAAAASSVQTATTTHAQTIAQLVADQATKLAQAETAKNAAEAASAQAVIDKEKEMNAALAAYLEKQAEFKKTQGEHQQNAKSLRESFNHAAKDIRTAIAAEKEAAAKAAKAAKAAAKKQVADARAAGRQKLWAETVALIQYDIFVTKDTAVRLVNGTVAVGKALSTAFKAGYSADTGVAPPAYVLQRQAQAAAAATTPAATEQAPKAAEPQGPTA